MLMAGHLMLRLHVAAPLLGMTTRCLRETLGRPGHGMTVHEKQGQSGTIRYLRADEVAQASGGIDGRLLGETAKTASGR
jgi:hypothetical protein